MKTLWTLVALTALTAAAPLAAAADGPGRAAIGRALSNPELNACVRAAREPGFQIRADVESLGSCPTGPDAAQVSFTKAPRCAPGRVCAQYLILVGSAVVGCDRGVTEVTCFDEGEPTEPVE